MKSRPLLRSCLVLLFIGIGALGAKAQGGTYHGPGDPQPPPESPGGADTAPPTSPGVAPTPSGQPPPTGVGPSVGQPSAPTPGAQSNPSEYTLLDLSDWTYWWYFNRDRLLAVKARSKRPRWIEGVPIQAAAGLHGKVVDETVLPLLLALTDPKEHASTRASALIALGRSAEPGNPTVRAALERTWDDEDAVVRECATLAYGINADVDATARLAERLANGPKGALAQGPHDRSRAFAAFSLGILAAKTGHPGVGSWAALYLTRVLADSEEHVDLRVACAVAIGQVRLPWGPGPESSPTRTRSGLTRLLLEIEAGAKDARLRAHVLTSIARLVDPDIPQDLLGPILERLAKLTEPTGSESPLVMQAATTAFGLIGEGLGPDRVGPLIERLVVLASRPGQSQVRQLAWIALAELCPLKEGQRIQFVLVAELEAGGPQDQPWACLALGMLGFRYDEAGQQLGAAALRELRGRLGSEVSTAAKDAATLALGLARDQDSIEPLSLALRTSPNRQTRGFAALALGLIGYQPAAGVIAKQLPGFAADQLSLEHAALGLSLLDRKLASHVLSRELDEAPSPNSASFLAAAMGRSGDLGSLMALQATIASKRASAWARAYAAVAIGMLAERSDLPWRSILAWRTPYEAQVLCLYDQEGRGVLNLL